MTIRSVEASGQPKLLQRRQRIPTAGVWYDAQLKQSDRREFAVVVFRLACCAVRAEVPLLAHDFPEGLAAIRRPPQHILLRPPGTGFQKVQ
ncbi:MAG: hypothetical protein KC592_17370, partial [Nitrospira sp.]|nr:hypothetical protein [Nitrospira sp.]